MKNINIVKLNKIYIVFILITVFLNWNLNFLPSLGKEAENFFVSFKMYSVFSLVYPFIEKIIKIIYYFFTCIYIGINIIFLIKEDKNILKLNLKRMAYLCFITIFIIQIKYLNFSRILFFLNITSLMFFTEYLYSKESKIFQNNKMFFLIFLNLVLQFFSLNYNGRKTLSWLDPNFSSYFLFLFYVITDNSFKDKKYKILNLIIIIGGLLISSRSFFLSIMIYIFLKNEKISKVLENLLIKIKLNSSIVLLILNVLCTMFFAQFYIKNAKPEYSYKQDITRLLSFNDNSNFARFVYFINFKENLIKNKELRNVGLSSKEYKKIGGNFPHNGSAEVIRKYGIYIGVFALIIIFKSIFFKLNDKNIAFFLSFLVYQTFLGVPLEGASLLLLAYINFILINPEKI